MTPNQEEGTSLGFSLLFMILSACSIVCNFLILVLVLRKKVFKDTCQARLLIGHVAFVDFLASFSFLQASIGLMNQTILPSEKKACHVLSYFNMLLVFEKYPSFLLLAIHRYFLIKRPFGARQIFTRKKTLAYVICTWLVSLSVALIPDMLSHGKEYLSVVGMCLFAFDGTITVLCISIRSIIYISTVFFYVKGYIAYRHSQRSIQCKGNNSFLSCGITKAITKGTRDEGIIGEYELSKVHCRKESSNAHPDIIISRFEEQTGRNAISSGPRKRSRSFPEGVYDLDRLISTRHGGIHRSSSFQICSKTDPWQNKLTIGVKSKIYRADSSY